MYRSHPLFFERALQHRRLVVILVSSWSMAFPALAGRQLAADEVLPDPLPAIAAANPAASAAIDGADVVLTGDSPKPSRPAPSANVTINLINRMVARGLLPKEEADELIKQAEADAEEARAQAAAEQYASIQQAVAQAVATMQASPQFDPVAALGADDAIRVTYIPEVVKAQLRDEIRNDVLAQARTQKWGTPYLAPEWTTRIKL